MKKTSNSEVEENYSFKKLIYIQFVEKSGIHFFYIVLILVGLIVYLSSANFAENVQVVAYVSFAATISSLILAVFAIFYAVHSNSDLAKSFNDIKGTATTINLSAKDVESASNALLIITKELSSKINDFSDDVKIIPHSVNQGFDKIGTILNSQRHFSDKNNENVALDELNEVDLKEVIVKVAILPCNVTLLVMYLSFKAGVILNQENLKSLRLAISLDFAYMAYCALKHFGFFEVENLTRKEIKVEAFDEDYFNLILKQVISEIKEFTDKDDTHIIKERLLFSFSYFNVDIPDELKSL